ncbi:MAG: helix-turn-helix domain-containing protein [Lachnospiraceae bacterium]|nr:helix-turn-helix domain-containing protein [Lachnospiraceae bacterium]
MQMNKDFQKAPLESDQDFANFLQRVRKERDIHFEQLAEGLMSISQLSRIEKGQRPVHKNMRDRLLGRLGIASDLYENLLDIDDYRAWECQRNILLAVEQRETQKAQRLIAEYERKMSSNSKLKQQFCLVMKAEALKQQNADSVEIGACYEKAVKMTVPKIEDLCLAKSLLSIQEINMVLEYEFYTKDKGRNFLEKSRALMAFVENTVYDELSKVKIYPKIAYYYLREVFSDQSRQTAGALNESLRICNQAIEMLRDTGRAFYLLELLEVKCKILEIIEEGTDEYRESRELENLLRKLYEEYGIPAYMQDCVYLYRQRWIFYIGDVLRIRRKMYGLTQEELCKGICATKTLRRTEKMERNMHQDLLKTLMRRLGLSKEYQRARLVTNDREVLKLRDELLICRNNHDIARCRDILNLMKEKLLLEIPENQQYIIELETSLDWMENKITKEELVIREEKALKCTLDIDKLFLADEIYLTEMEMSCIRKMIQGIEGEKKRRYINLLWRFFDCYEKKYVLSDYIAMYEFVMIRMASELANMGEFNIATDIDNKILKESLKCNRVWAVSNILYDILWNDKEQKEQSGQDLEKEKMTERLKQCILLSHFCKQTFEEKFYNNKLYQE